VNASIAPIHLGVGASSSSRGPAAPLPERYENEETAEHELQDIGPGRRLAVVVRVRRAGDEEDDRPTTARPVSQPTTKAGPLTRARGVTSIRITAMIGTGLSATPTAKGRISPIAWPMRAREYSLP
jgi:hypothetical protein